MLEALVNLGPNSYTYHPGILLPWETDLYRGTKIKMDWKIDRSLKRRDF